jgi:hypothetical protein
LFCPAGRALSRKPFQPPADPSHFEGEIQAPGGAPEFWTL